MNNQVGTPLGDPQATIERLGHLATRADKAANEAREEHARQAALAAKYRVSQAEYEAVVEALRVPRKWIAGSSVPCSSCGEPIGEYKLRFTQTPGYTCGKCGPHA